MIKTAIIILALWNLCLSIKIVIIKKKLIQICELQKQQNDLFDKILKNLFRNKEELK